MKGGRTYNALRGLTILSFFIFHFLPSYAQIGMQPLGDSLMNWTGFSRIWSPIVRVKQMRVNGNEVVLRTNLTLKDVRWTPQNVAEVQRKVSTWTLGHPHGKVTIYTGDTEISTLITPCARKTHKPVQTACDLTDRNIALWPSHGLYYNAARDEWIWQRATLWTTVEDLYSQEYVRLLRTMLRNAGANILMPRAGLENQEIGESGMPKWTEAARYWLIEQGADSAIWNNYGGNEYKDDMKCRPLWVNSLETPVDLCLALHTDGLDSEDDTTIVGTLCIYTAHDDEGQKVLRDGRDREKVNRNLADYIQTQVTEDLRHIAPQWTRRQLKEANYCESRVPVVPSVLVELLSHKNMADMHYGLDPQFRFVAARALYKGILRYLNGSDAVVQPLPIQELGIFPTTNDKRPTTNAVLRWIPVKDSLERSAAPTYYMVYVQQNDGEWDVQQVEKDTQLKLNLKPGVRYNYYVVAGNEGGLSFPSPIVSACLTSNSAGGPTSNSEAVLIVDAFDDVYGPEWFADSVRAGIVPGSYACEDRFSCAYIGEQWDFERSHPWVNDDNCGWGACYRDHAGQLIVGNTRDWSLLHGRALQQMKISYTSCTAGMLTNRQSPITNYPLIDLICGRNRTPFPAGLEPLLSDYLQHGGRLLLSTDHFSAINAKWAKRYLHTSFYAAHATHSGRILGPHRHSYQILLKPNAEQLFTCTPEGLKSEGEGATPFVKYQDMRCPAAVGFKAPAMNEKIPIPTTLVYGFPLEAATDFESLYHHSIDWLLKE